MEEVAEILQLLATDPLAAAARLDALADRLHAQAAQIRAALASEQPWQSPGGMNDRVRMRVTGPDGAIRQQTDTGA